MDLGLSGRVALVGGASRGLGYATAQALARDGARVCLFSRDPARIEEATDRLARETGAETLGVAGDAANAEDISRWCDAAVERFGGVDLLFANTGGPPAGGFDSADDAVWQAGFEMIVLGPIRMVRAVLPSMRARGGGAVLVSTSASVKQPIPNLTVSTVLRGSLTTLSKTLADELAGDGIRVNHLVPGRIDTDRVRHLDRVNAERQGISVAEARAKSEATIPIGRYGEPEEYGRAAAFLLSPAASYITGATLQVDGGLIRSVL